ncbi:hypothetical protein DUC43_002526, partial [Enterococcus faecalis]|nr:hypothetical protein [Enterococcus faecalis]
FLGCGSQVFAASAPQMKSLEGFNSLEKYDDLQGTEHAFAKVLNYKTKRTDITAKSILKYVYPTRRDKELENSSASIKDCMRYAESLGVTMQWNDETTIKYDNIKQQIDSLNPVLLCFKPDKFDWMEPYLLTVAYGYVYVEGDGQVNKNFMMASIWNSKYITPTTINVNSNVNNLRVTDFSTNGNPQKDYSYIGSITLN